MKEIKELLLKTIQEAGDSASDSFGKLTDDQISYKYPGKRGIVTEVDIKIDAYIREAILARFPTHDIISEENESINNSGNYVWIIDPIDGTNNYVQGKDHYCISIGIAKEGEIVMGAIYAPELNELFFTQKGEGVFLNGKKLEHTLSPKVCYVDDKRLSNKTIKDHFIGCDEIHLGSAALELAYVAQGRSMGSMLENIMIWDIAAGLLMVQEMGGKVLNFKQKPFTLSDTNLLALYN